MTPRRTAGWLVIAAIIVGGWTIVGYMFVIVVEQVFTECPDCGYPWAGPRLLDTDDGRG